MPRFNPILRPLLLMGIHVLLTCSLSQAQGSRWDLLGDSHYSKNNFTDRAIPYNGADTWSEFRLTHWFNKKEKAGLFSSLLASNMFFLPRDSSIERFQWQNYLQSGMGLQYYPFFKKEEEKEAKEPANDNKNSEKEEKDNLYNPLFGFRLFLQGGLRWYYDEGQTENPFSNYITRDFQFGFDYYYDEPLFNEDKCWTLIAWTNGTFRATNFSLEKYNSFLWTGNLKAGIKWPRLNPIILYYGVADWTYVASPCDCRWWENYIRGGGGIRVYPYTPDGKGLFSELLRRLHLYGEYQKNLMWLKDKPEDMVRKEDWRFGIGFSTSGFFRSK